MKRTRSFLFLSSSLLVTGILNVSVAFGEAAPAVSTDSAIKSGIAAQSIDEKQIGDSIDVVSDGSPIDMKSLGISFRAPAGWLVSTKSNGLSVVMREPKPPVKANDYETIIFQRNITIATVHEASPIDEARAAALKAQLTQAFSKDGMVSEFEVIESKLFNYRQTNDGILVYSVMKLGEFKMMQMHVLVSGQAKQFLMTYTDLEDRFRGQGPAGYETAWQSMMSLEVTGNAPKRYENLIRYGSVGGGVLFLFVIIGTVRRRSATKDYLKDADVIYRDDEDVSAVSIEKSGLSALSSLSTMSNVWKLSSVKNFNDENISYDEVEETDLSDEYEDTGKTKLASKSLSKAADALPALKKSSFLTKWGKKKVANDEFDDVSSEDTLMTTDEDDDFRCSSI